jgi:putative transposase
VSKSDQKSVREYILDQQKHHRTRNFQDEFLVFIEKYEVEYDPRYLWD